MWRQVGRQILTTRYFAEATTIQHIPPVYTRKMPKLGHPHTLPRCREASRAPKWYNNLKPDERDLLESMILNFLVNATNIETVIKLIAHKFSISLRLAREVIKLRSNNANSDLSLEMGNKLEMQKYSVMQLAKWEKMAVASKHNYTEEVFMTLLDEEAKQETTWHVVREGVARLAVFAPRRQACVELMTTFSVKHRLQSKTTEASLVYLVRFLLSTKATTILDSNSGLNGASGKHSLRAVAMCILMLSSKFEEVYPPALASFSNFARYTPSEFRKLEATLLGAMNWKMITSTSADYIGRFFKAVKCAQKTYLLAMFILEAS